MLGALACSGITRAAETEAEAKARNEAVVKVRKEAIQTKLKATRVPHVKFEGATVEEALEQLKAKCVEADAGTEGPAFGELHFKVYPSHGFKPKEIRFEEKNATAAALVDKIAEQAGMRAEWTIYGMRLWPKVIPKPPVPEQEATEFETTVGAVAGRTMEVGFAWMKTATVRASLLALAVLAIQWGFGRRLPARWRHALWLPMVLVLILPFLPAIPFHPFATEPKSLATPAIEVGALAGKPVTPTAAVAMESVKRGVNPWAVAWLTGACVVMGMGLTGYRRNLKRIEGRAEKPHARLSADILAACHATGLKKAPRVMVSPEVSSPAVTGLFRSVLLLPRDFPAGFTAAEAKLILLHELTHLKRRDLPLNWLLCVLQALHWFNPILWFAFARMRTDREAACDADVLSLDSGDHRSDYGHALLKLQATAPSSGLSLGFVGIFENASALRTRIQYISTHRRSHPAWRAAGVAMIGVLTLVGATQAQERQPRREAKGVQNGKAKDPRQVALEKKMDAIVVPVITFEDTTLEEAVDFLRLRSRELDKTTEDPAEKGVNFVIRNSTPAQPKTVTLALRDVTLRKAIENVAEAAGLSTVVGPFAVTLMSREDLEQFEKRAKLAQSGAMKRASEIIIPIVDIENAGLKETVEFLNKRAGEIAPDGNAPKIEVGELENEETKITAELRLRNVPLSQVLIYVAEATKAPLSADDEVIRFGK